MEQTTLHSTSAITEEVLIGELVEHHPEIIDTLLSYGVHCIGCHVSPYESLGDGFRGHGMSEPEIAAAIVKLNEVIRSTTKDIVQVPSGWKVEVSDLAAKKIQEFCSSHQKKALRVGLKRGGCSGYMYTFDLVDNPMNGDAVVQQKGVQLFVDTANVEKLEGAIIDYKDTLQDAGFKILIPKAASSCGCGKSVGF